MTTHTDRATRIEMKLEVVPIPVSDVDAAKTFIRRRSASTSTTTFDPTTGCGSSR